MRQSRRFEKRLDAQPSRKVGHDPRPTLGPVDEAAHEPRDGQNATIVPGVCFRWDAPDFFELTRTSRQQKAEAAHVIGGIILQNDRAIFAIDIDPVAGTPKRRGAHDETAGGAIGERERHADEGSFGRRYARKTRQAGRQPE